MRMKKAYALAMALIFSTAGVDIASAGSQDVITDYDTTQHVHMEYNAFGVALEGTNTTTTTTTTNKKEGGQEKEVEVVVVESSWQAGSLKAESIEAKVVTKSSDDTITAQTYTDDYNYAKDGTLKEVSGEGEFYSIEGGTGKKRQGDIDRNFRIEDGQALLEDSTTRGDLLDKNRNDIGDFTSKSDPTKYQYLGGEWVAMEQVSTNTSKGNDGSSDNQERILTFTRDANGTIIGMSQSASGSREVVTGGNGSQTSKKTETMKNYKATFGFHSKIGWFMASEDYDMGLETPIQASTPSGNFASLQNWVYQEYVAGRLTASALQNYLNNNPFSASDTAAIWQHWNAGNLYDWLKSITSGPAPNPAPGPAPSPAPSGNFASLKNWVYQEYVASRLTASALQNYLNNNPFSASDTAAIWQHWNAGNLYNWLKSIT